MDKPLPGKESIATFSIIGNLNDFIRKKNRDKVIEYSFTGTPSIKDAIEAIGIPHVEVIRIIVNNTSVRFLDQLHPQDKVEVFPLNMVSTDLDEGSLMVPFEQPIKFIADVHLGKLVKALRMLGIDTSYENNYNDPEIVNIAVNENRVVLTRDVGLLKHKVLPWGYWLRSQQTSEQLREVFTRFKLTPQVKPFTRCLECNGIIHPVPKEQVLDKIPDNTRKFFEEFYQCTCCNKVYWKGSHFQRMENSLKSFLVQNN